MESWHSAPLPGYEGIAAAGMTKVNTYYNIRLADIVGADPIVHQDNVDDTGVSVSKPEVGEADDTSRYATAGEQPGAVNATTNADMPSTRTLKDWIADIHGRGGEGPRGRPLVDSPISHYNCWVRTPTPQPADHPSGLSDRGNVPSPATRMETGDEKERTDVVPPTSDTPISVYKGGEDKTHEKHFDSTSDNRLITTRAYIIRVDHLKKTASPLPTTDTPPSVYDSVSEYVTESMMDTSHEMEKPGLVRPMSDTQGSVYDGGGVLTHERLSARGAEGQPVRTCTVRLNDMRNIHNLLKDRRDRLNVDTLKLCSGATLSEDDELANE